MIPYSVGNLLCQPASGFLDDWLPGHRYRKFASPGSRSTRSAGVDRFGSMGN